MRRPTPAVVGRYVLSADIWPLLAKTPPGAGDEIQLTDAIDMLIEKETVEAYHMKGKSHDCGNKLGYMQAFVEYGIRHKTLGDDFKASAGNGGSEVIRRAVESTNRERICDSRFFLYRP